MIPFLITTRYIWIVGKGGIRSSRPRFSLKNGAQSLSSSTIDLGLCRRGCQCQLLLRSSTCPLLRLLSHSSFRSGYSSGSSQHKTTGPEVLVSWILLFLVVHRAFEEYWCQGAHMYFSWILHVPNSAANLRVCFNSAIQGIHSISYKLSRFCSLSFTI
uniref:Uncharacterized protein n=1 Tax=Setaria viridis TaxID=4556 RepID=A0A4U6VQZ5_SETVI|nr:hypothetical protein SEVIR_2G090500v2 [Setaria viridis]